MVQSVKNVTGGMAVGIRALRGRLDVECSRGPCARTATKTTRSRSASLARRHTPDPSRAAYQQTPTVVSRPPAVPQSF